MLPLDPPWPIPAETQNKIRRKKHAYVEHAAGSHTMRKSNENESPAVPPDYINNPQFPQPNITPSNPPPTTRKKKNCLRQTLGGKREIESAGGEEEKASGDG